MSQVITIRVSLHCERCRRKTMTICMTADGVNSAAFEGRDTIVMRGERVDAAAVTARLRQRVSKHAMLVSVANDG
ncbi:hypothetical protein VIGAN_03021900 [Vigna angularis var. angularis]|uniref:HMA domain-containing protein n=1 Tax=Vigna angularis var. angularis TaxID=157739 RepID=A0A0S3RJ23_PHAAN|nr:heavy metal-associated isoprenylated plant protein 47-like [Vigna angularis]BAT80626.1 hypothetical protein VIGAN_03021900 [Vigna angularis var. angularis]